MANGDDELKDAQGFIGCLIAVVAILFVACLVGFPSIWIYGRSVGREDERKQAAREGVAEYSFDRKTGEAQFSYVLPALPEGVEWIHSPRK